MSSITKKTAFIGSILLVGSVCCGVLVGCGDNHKNPLNSKEIIDHFNGDLFLSDAKHTPFKDCSSYYGWGKHPEYKGKCDAWSEREYRNSLADRIIPSTTTLNDFRDPEFWKLVNPDAIEDKQR